MRKLKKSLSIILAALMIMSVMAISAGASSYVTNKLEYYNVAETPTYSETFDTETDVDNFVSGATFDEENQRMELKRATDTKAANYYAVFPDVNQSSYFEFDVLADSSIQRVEYRLTPSNDTNARQTRLYFFNDGTISSLFGNGDRYDANIKAKVGEMNSIKMLIDYETQRGYIWVNNSLCQWKVDNGKLCDGFTLISNELATSTGVINIHIPKETGTGSIYIDNFKITPLKKNGYKPVLNEETYLCNETFEAYEEGPLANEKDGTISDSDIIATGLVGKNGILNTTTSGTGGSAPHKLEIYKEADGNKVLKSPEAGWLNVHNLFFSKASSYGQGANNYLVVQVKLKAVSDDSGAYFYADLGTGAEKSHQVKVYIYKPNADNDQTGVSINGTKVSGTDYIDGQWHTITYLLDKNAGDKGKASLWIDDTLLGNSEIGYQFDCPNSIKEGWPVALYLRNKSEKQMDLYIDDLIAFDGESFMNVKNMDAALIEIADFSDMGTDSAPVDFSADVLKAAASVTSETATATFTDSKGYYNGENIVFPLYEDTTDVLVEISDGNVKTMKEFTNVPIMPAYSISGKTPSTDISNVADFNAGAISATVRNAASNISGRLNVFAAIYESEGGKLLKVEKQADTLGNDGKFECKLDLSGFAETDLTNAVIKLFIFENGTLVPLN